jgi:hypothetical protein
MGLLHVLYVLSIFSTENLKKLHGYIYKVENYRT